MDAEPKTGILFLAHIPCIFDRSGHRLAHNASRGFDADINAA
jgi:hypothetical protein